MTPTEEQFIESMGRYFEADGVPRIGGRLLGFLLLQEEPRSLDDISAALAVSKASISTNARLLMYWGLIERVTRPGDRRDYYVPATDLTRTLEFRVERVSRLVELLQQGAAAVEGSREEPARRLRRMAAFNAEAGSLMRDLLSRWREP